MSATSSPMLFTIPQIAGACGVPIHRVRYIVESRGIQSAGRLAHYRYFDDDAVKAIKAELRTVTLAGSSDAAS